MNWLIISSWGSPEESSICLESLNPTIFSVCHIDSSVFVNCNSCWEPEMFRCSSRTLTYSSLFISFLIINFNKVVKGWNVYVYIIINRNCISFSRDGELLIYFPINLRDCINHVVSTDNPDSSLSVECHLIWTCDLVCALVKDFLKFSLEVKYCNGCIFNTRCYIDFILST